MRVLGVVEARWSAEGLGRHRVRHDVVGGEDLGVRQVVLHHVCDQLQRRATRSVLHAVVPIVKVSIVTPRVPLRCAAPGFVAEVHQKIGVVVDDGAAPIRQQPVVGAPNQELVELRTRHQPTDCRAQRRPAALGGRILLVRRRASREYQRRPAQGLAHRRHRYRVEQRLRGQRHRRDVLAQQPQEPLHVLVVGGARRYLHPAPVGHTLNLVQDVSGAVLHLREEVLEHLQVVCLMVGNRRGQEHQPRVPRQTALDVAVHALRLHDGLRDVLAEHLRHRLPDPVHHHLAPNRGQIRQMTRRARQQAHHLDGLLRRHPQLPLAPARAERTAQPFRLARLQLPGRERTRRARRKRELHRPVRRPPIVVGPLDAYLGGLRPEIDDSQAAHLADVPARIECHHPMLRPGRRRHVVHAGQKAVLGADVGQYLKLQWAREHQAPVALARARGAVEPLAGIARLQVVGVEVLRLVRIDGQRHRSAVRPLVVPGVDMCLARLVAAVDDPHEALAPQRVRGGGKQRDRMCGGDAVLARPGVVGNR